MHKPSSKLHSVGHQSFLGLSLCQQQHRPLPSHLSHLWLHKLSRTQRWLLMGADIYSWFCTACQLVWHWRSVCLMYSAWGGHIFSALICFCLVGQHRAFNRSGLYKEMHSAICHSLDMIIMTKFQLFQAGDPYQPFPKCPSMQQQHLNSTMINAQCNVFFMLNNRSQNLRSPTDIWH